jgi:hypothetical protein
MYHAERALEVQALCDPGVRDALAVLGIDLPSFADLSGPLHRPTLSPHAKRPGVARSGLPFPLSGVGSPCRAGEDSQASLQ